MSRALFVIIGLLSLGASARADVSLVNHQGETVSLDTLSFKDETGAEIRLDLYFHRARPVIVLPVFYGCAGACTIALNQLVTTLKHVAVSAGKGFEVVVVGIDAREGPALARAKKEFAVLRYERPEAAQGWHFLTGTDSAIRKLTSQLGFGFVRDPVSGALSHPSAYFVLTPEGVISKALPSLGIRRKELWLALYEASHGRAQRFFDRVDEVCELYVSHEGRVGRLLRRVSGWARSRFQTG